MTHAYVELRDAEAAVRLAEQRDAARLAARTDAASARRSREEAAALNQTLSRQRTESVRRFLVDRGIDGGRVNASDFDFERPAASNATTTGRQQIAGLKL